MAKTLKTKESNLLGAYLSINAIPPKDFASDDDMVKARAIKEALLENKNVEVYKKLLDDHTDLVRAVQQERMTEEDANEQLKDINKKKSALESKMSEAETTATLEDEYFNKLFDFFNQKGKAWFTNIDTYLGFKDDLDEANKQPKSKK